jgi:hypothetical protein
MSDLVRPIERMRTLRKHVARRRIVKTTIQPQDDRDWMLVIKHGISYYIGGPPGKPGYGWCTGLWTARRFHNMGDVVTEIRKWDPRNVPGKLEIRRVWIGEGDLRATTKVGEGLTYAPKTPPIQGKS